MKIGSFQGISQAYFIRNDVQELQSMKNQKALNSYRVIQNSLDRKNPSVRDYGAAVVEISQEARDLASAGNARSASVEGLIKLSERKDNK
jgi:hypothetical protein